MADTAMISTRFSSFSRRRRHMWLPFSNGHAEPLVAAFPVLGLAALAAIRDELAAGAVLEHGTVVGHAAVGALLGGDKFLRRSHCRVQQTAKDPRLWIPFIQYRDEPSITITSRRNDYLRTPTYDLDRAWRPVQIHSSKSCLKAVERQQRDRHHHQFIIRADLLAYTFWLYCELRN